jgi:hypothetical protein
MCWIKIQRVSVCVKKKRTGVASSDLALKSCSCLGSPVSGVDGADKEQERFRFFRIFLHEGLEDFCCAVAVMVCLRFTVHLLNRIRQGVCLDIDRLVRLVWTQLT